MKCPNHPDREGEFMCVECARMFCAECIHDRAGRPFCPECLAKAQQEPTGGEEAKQPAEPRSGAVPPSEPHEPSPPAPPAPPVPPRPPMPAPGYTPAAARPSGIAIASMVCGILSLVCCCGGLNLVLGVVAIVLGAAALGSSQPGPVRAASRAYAIVGIATGAAAIVLGVLAIVGWFAFSEMFPRFHQPWRGRFI